MPSSAPRPQSTWGSYEQLHVRHDASRRAVWYTLDPRPRPCFNPGILAELRRFHDRLREINGLSGARGGDIPVQYTVLASAVPRVFNLGGDLSLFSELIHRRDREALLGYAKACIDVLHPNAVGFDQSLTTITLVQGDALGGGCEAALSSHVVVAERSARFGLPEILFNLIPGMGAYSILIRRTTPQITRRFITAGEIYDAEQMLRWGLIHRLVEDGEGPQAVAELIDEHRSRRNAYVALDRAQRVVDRIPYEELLEITRIWVDAALELEAKDLRRISALVRAQNHCRSRPGAGPGALEAWG